MEKALRKWFPIFVLPTLAAFCVGFIWPFIQGIYLSFCQFITVDNAKWIGVTNYVKALTDATFKDSFFFTVSFAIVSTLLINGIAFLIALALTKEMKGTNAFRTVFFMPNLIGGIVLGYTWQQMINALLYQYETTIVSQAKYGFIGLVVLMNWQMIGYMMIIYIAGIQNVSTDLLEAAEIDGATSWQKLTKVTIPMVMPSITICMFLTLSNSFKLFDQNKALTNGAPMKKTELLALNIYNTFYDRTGYEGVGQAKAVMFFILVAVIALLQLRLTRSKEVDQ